jgi:hypothetical protein
MNYCTLFERSKQDDTSITYPVTRLESNRTSPDMIELRVNSLSHIADIADCQLKAQDETRRLIRADESIQDSPLVFHGCFCFVMCQSRVDDFIAASDPDGR